jgi:aminodeoxyfutalosine synthase
VARKAHQQGATEVHIVGGLHPWLKFDYYTAVMAGIRAACPGLHIKAFTAVEIVHLSRIARMSIREVLLALREAGLGSLPGGGAEIFDDRVHDEVFKGKVRADRWFEVHRTAHGLGIYSNATMLYGHVETPEERLKHLIKLRELQDESLGKKGEERHEGTEARRHEGNPEVPATKRRSESFQTGEATKGNARASFNCVVPLSFAPENSELGHLPGPTGLSDLRTLAISRLMLDNIPHVKAFWIMQGIGLSQVALSYGCDDLDGTVVWYDITKRVGQGTHQEMTVEKLHRLIREAGFVPVERDTLYHEITGRD